jgi:PAS domain S-box-containing protein
MVGRRGWHPNASRLIGSYGLGLAAAAGCSAMWGVAMTGPNRNAREAEITEARQAQQALGDREERYALVARASAEGIYDWNVVTNQLYTSARLCELIGIAETDAANIDWNRRIHPDDFQHYRQALVAHFKRQSPRLRCEYRVQVRSGEYRWFLDSGLAVRDETGRCVRLVGAISDITERKNAEDALRESEERYELAMDAINEAVYDWRIDRDEIYYSPNIHSQLGFSGAELRTPEDWRRRIHPDDAVDYRAAMLAHFKGLTPRFERTYRYCAADGSWRWVRQHGIALRDASGRAYRMIGATGDVTDAKLTEQALERARTRLNEAIEAVSEGFAWFDADDRLVLCNTQFREFYAGAADVIVPGMSFEQMLRGTMERDVIAGAGDRSQEWFAQRMQRHRDPSAPQEYQLSDGRWLKISERKTAEGGIVGVYTDITALKTRESQLSETIDRAAKAKNEAEQARARLFDAIESITEGFVLFDADDRIALCNSRYRRFFAELAGNDVGSLIVEGTQYEDFLRAAYSRGMFPDREQNADRWVERIMQHRRMPQGPRERPLADGRWLQVSERRTLDGGLVAVYTDVTERKRIEEEIRAARDAAETSLRDLQKAQASLLHTQKMAALGQLTAGIAHEIKNPLNFVNNFSAVSIELIDELRGEIQRATVEGETRAEIEELATTLRDNLAKIVQHGNRADLIVKNMLLHSREGSGEHRPVDINAIVEEALNLAYHGARAEKSGFNIALERSLDPAAGRVDCFPQEVTRVLLNLISNGFYAASKRHTQTKDKGHEPKLAASTRDLGDRVEIRIRDNGTGIRQDVREKMFNPFFTTKPAGEGTGLGLSISYDIIVKQHGGTLEVDTRPGEFTEFRIVLPRAAAFLAQAGGHE